MNTAIYEIIDVIKKHGRNCDIPNLYEAFASDYFLRIGELPNSEDLQHYLMAYVVFCSEGKLDSRFADTEEGRRDFGEFMHCVIIALENPINMEFKWVPHGLGS